MRITRPFVLLALAALLAPHVEASRTSAWESNPPASLTATNADEAAALASLVPAAAAAADVDAAELPAFDLGDVVLVDPADADAEHFHFGPLTLVDLNLLRGPPSSYPETRVGGFELLPPFRIGASPTLSLWSRQACGFSCLGLASDSRYDPWGLSERTQEMKDQSCAVTGIGCPATHDANAIWNSQVVQGTVEAVGGAAQAGVGVFALTAPDPTLLTKAAGWIAVLRGLDHMAAGWRSVWARKPIPAVSGAVLEGAFGGYGPLAGVVLDLGSTGLSARAMSPRNIEAGLPAEAAISPAPALSPARGVPSIETFPAGRRLDLSGRSVGFGNAAHPGEKGYVYLLRDVPTGQFLKVGKTTGGPNIYRRFNWYRRKSQEFGFKVELEYWEVSDSKKALAIEAEIRGQLESRGFSLPWDKVTQENRGLPWRGLPWQRTADTPVAPR